jgi:hypothetical protein
MVDTKFLNKLNEVCGELGMNPRDLLLVMYMESGVQSGAKNPKGAMGLIQFAPDTLRSMKVKEDDISNFTHKSGIEQLDYVKKFISAMEAAHNDGKPFGSATKYYCCNFYPISLNKWHGENVLQNINVIVVSSKSNDRREINAYNDNKILDVNGDGIITVGDIAKMLAGKANETGFQNLLAQLNDIIGPGTMSERFKIKKHVPHRSPESLPNTQDAGQQLSMPDFIKKIDNILDGLLSTTSKTENNKFLIKLNSGIYYDFNERLEFARILKLAIEEELKSNSNIYIDNDNIEMECNIYSDNILAKAALQELCAAVSDAFGHATKKIGSIYIEADIFNNKRSNFKKLDYQTAITNYKQFQSKFN